MGRDHLGRGRVGSKICPVIPTLVIEGDLI